MKKKVLGVLASLAVAGGLLTVAPAAQAEPSSRAAAQQSAATVQAATRAVYSWYEYGPRSGVSAVKVRTGPSTSRTAIGTLKRGQTFAYAGSKSGKWIKVVYRNQKGRYGWVHSSYVKRITVSSTKKPAYVPARLLR